MVDSRRARKIKHVVCEGVMINVNINFATKADGKQSRERARYRHDDNIIINLKKYYVFLVRISQETHL
jgi:hypothetical protein